MKRNNIILILIIIVIIVGAAVAFTSYEQQQVKMHLNKANAYHSQMMSYNPQITNAASLKQVGSIITKAKPSLTNELNELRAANTIFTSPTQKEYIDAAIQVNTDNSKIFELDLLASKSTKLSELTGYASRINDIDKDVITSANTRDSIVAAHPEEFGFEVVKN